jgi:hypothetical protein
VNPEPAAAEQLIPFCALEAPMLVLSNDRLLASVAPPPFETFPMRLRRQFEGWVGQVERAAGHALSRLLPPRR